MANSENVVPGAGPGSVLAVPLYEEQDDIHVAKGLVDQDASTYEWTGPQEITLGPDFPAADDVPVRVYRQTEDDALPAILDPEEGFDFQGANANWQRVLFLIQELKDRGGVAGIEDVLALLQAAVDDAEAEADIAEGFKNQAAGYSASAAGFASDASGHALNAYDAMVGAQDAETIVTGLMGVSVRVDTSQSFTNNQKKQARENTGARGNLFKVTVVTVSNPTWAFDPLSKYAEVEVIGGGGSGGGALGTTSAGQCSIGSGGGGGGFSRKFFEIASATAAVVVGAGAAPVSGASGAVGGITSFTATGVSLSANGGGAGTTPSISSTGSLANGAAGGTSSGGDINFVGGYGTGGLGFGTADMPVPLAWPGDGGGSMYGGTTRGNRTKASGANQAAGLNAASLGGGGSGGYSLNGGSAVAGGAGGAGFVIIREYY